MSLSDAQIREYAAFAERLADAARSQTLPRFRKAATVFNKAGPWFDPVTDADREAERVQRDMIEKIYPDHGVIGEEFGVSGGAGPSRWVLDPVDGTRAFVCGVATWATLIALEHEKQPVIGLIDQPFTEERFVGAPGGAVYEHRGVRRDCRASAVTKLAKARVSTTDPRPEAYFSGNEAAAFARVAGRAQLARFSMDAYAYGLLAIGEIDLVIETGLQHHDYAALAPVVVGAGGVFTNWRGEPVGSDDRGAVIAAATPELHAEALALLAG